MSNSKPNFNTLHEADRLEQAGVTVEHAKAFVEMVQKAQADLTTDDVFDNSVKELTGSISQMETTMQAYADANSAQDREFVLQEIKDMQYEFAQDLLKLMRKFMDLQSANTRQFDKFREELAELRETVAANNANVLAVIAQDQKTRADERAQDKKELAEQRAEDKKERAEELVKVKRDMRNALYQAIMVSVAILAGVFYIVRIFNT